MTKSAWIVAGVAGILIAASGRAAEFTIASDADFNQGTYSSTRIEAAGNAAQLTLSATANGSWVVENGGFSGKHSGLTGDGLRYLYWIDTWTENTVRIHDTQPPGSTTPSQGEPYGTMNRGEIALLGDVIYWPHSTRVLGRYDVQNGSWTLGATQVPNGRSATVLEAGLDGFLYLIDSAGQLLRYNPTADSFTAVGAALAGCTSTNSRAGMAAAGTAIYRICYPDGSFYSQDTSTGALTQRATIPIGAVGQAPQLAYDGSDTVYATAGHNLLDFFAYSIAANVWRRLPSLPEVVSFPCCTDPPGLAVVGGTSVYAHNAAAMRDLWRFDVVTDYVASGSYTSAVFDSGGLADWDRLYWSSDVPAGTTLRAQLATAAAAAGPFNFVGPDGTPATYYTAAFGTLVPSTHDGQRYAQIRFYLETTDATRSPRVLNASLTYAFNAMAITTPTPLASATLGQSYSQTLAAAGGIPPYTWTVSADAPPAGLTLSSGGVLGGTPTAEGNVAFTVEVTDQDTPPAVGSKRFSLYVAPAPVAPAIDETAALAGAVGSAYAYDADGAASATGTAPITWSLSAGPASFNVDPFSGAVSWTPTAAGATAITLIAQNSAGTDSYSFTVEVAAAPVPPVVQPTANGAATAGLAYRYDADNRASATGTPPISWSVLSGPPELVIDAATGYVQWTPAAAGRADIVIRASNVAGANSYSFSVDVVPPATPPLIDETAALTASLGRSYLYDADGRASAQGSAPLSWSVASGPSGFAIDPTSGVVSWQPTAVGATDIVLVAANIAGTDDYSFTVTVSAPPEPPIIQATANLTAMAGLPYHYDVDDRASAGGTPPFAWSVADGPAELTIDAASGLVEWTPTAAGLVGVVLRASNAAGSYDYAFTIEVAAAPTPPLIDETASLTAQVGEAYAYDADGYASSQGTLPIVWSLLSGPPGFAVDTTTGLVSWMPAAALDAAVTLKATNAAGSDTYAFIIAVSGPPCAQAAAPPILLEPADGAEGVSTRFELRWWPVFGAESYIVEVVRLPLSGPPDFTDPQARLVDPPAEVTTALYSGAAEPESAYAWRVSALAAGCAGAPSGVRTFRTGGGSLELVAVAQGMTAAQASQGGGWHEGPLVGKAQLSVLLSDEASLARVGFPITDRLWDFGDNTPPEGIEEPVHTYLLPGGYRVHLELRDRETAGEDELQILAMDAQGRVPPQVDAVAQPARGQVGEELTFEARVLAGDAPVQMLLWDFGDDLRSNSPVLRRSYAAVGTYIVRLSAIDANGLTAEDFVAVTVTDAEGAEAPTVRLYGVTPLSGEPPLEVRLLCDARGAVGEGAHYVWDFGDGVTDDVSNAVLVSHTYAVGAAGEREYAPRCSVSNGALTSSDSVTVSLTSAGRFAPRVVSEPGTTACVGERYLYNEGNRAVARGTPDILWRAGKNVGSQIMGAPAGFSVDPSTGIIEWTPSSAQAGVQAVTLVAENDAGSALQEFTVEVGACGPAQPEAPSSSRAACGCRGGAAGWSVLLAVLLLRRGRRLSRQEP